MADFTTAARPYAKAVFEIARDEDAFDAWSGRLEFWAAVIGNPEMSQRLEAPGLTALEKASLIEKVDADGMDDHSRNFIRLLAENNRLEMMPDIAGIYQDLKAEAEGEIEAMVISAFELSGEQSDRIAAALSKRLDRRVRITSSVDNTLIGGAVIRAGDLVIDGSVKGRIDEMERVVAS